MKTLLLRLGSAAGLLLAVAGTARAQGRLLAVGQLLLNNTDNAVAAINGCIYVLNDHGGQGPWTEMPVPAPEVKDNPCPNYSSQLLPGTDGLTVLEVALNFVDGTRQAFYQTAPLPAPHRRIRREEAV